MAPDPTESAPALDEAEISVFGPGIGECVVVHLGNNEWMVVDSCFESQEAIALRYLRTIGVSPTRIRYVVVTHWHDDHIGGASQVLDAAKDATLVCSGALNRDEFRLLLKSWSQGFKEEAGLDEMLKLSRICLTRRKDRAAPVARIWALEGRTLPSNSHAQVRILSPSDHTMTLAFQELGRLVPRLGPKLRPVAQGPNRLAVVLWIDFDGFSALLGADLECTSSPGTGWSAVVSSNARPAGQASLFKVPHHGSIGADDSNVWQQMLVKDCIAVVTPFNALRHPLPTPDDQRRILARTSELYITSQPGGRRARREPDVEKQIRQMTRQLRVLQRPMGHVRVRCKPRSTPTIYLGGSAFHVGLGKIGT